MILTLQLAQPNQNLGKTIGARKHRFFRYNLIVIPKRFTGSARNILLAFGKQGVISKKASSTTLLICQTFYHKTSLRYYPTIPKINSHISLSSCQRLLRLLDKDHLLTKSYSLGDLTKEINTFYRLHGYNHSLFFKNIRALVTNNEISFIKEVYKDPLFFPSINKIAEIYN